MRRENTVQNAVWQQTVIIICPVSCENVGEANLHLHCGERRQGSEHDVQCCLEERVEEPWTFERVVRFIDVIGNREITLKSDTDFIQKSCC